IVQGPQCLVQSPAAERINDRNNLFQCLGYEGTNGKHWGAHPLQPRETVSHPTATIKVTRPASCTDCPREYDARADRSIRPCSPCKRRPNAAAPRQDVRRV